MSERSRVHRLRWRSCIWLVIGLSPSLGLRTASAGGADISWCFGVGEYTYDLQDALRADGSMPTRTDPAYTHGPCRFVRVSAGIIKARCKATVAPISYSLDEPTQVAMAVDFASGGTRYCTYFEGSSIKKDIGSTSGTGQFKATQAPALWLCPSQPIPCS